MLDHRKSGIQHKYKVDVTETSRLLYPDRNRFDYEYADEEYEDGDGGGDGHGSTGGSVWGSVFNLCNSAIGAGILALPYAFKESGVALGSILLVVMGLILCYTLKIIVWTNRLYPEVRSYEKLVARIFGKGTSVLVTLSVILTTFGSCIGFLVIVGDLMYAILSIVLDHFQNHPAWVDEWIVNKIFIIVVLSVLGVLPLASLKNFNSLRFSSTMAIASVTFTVIVIVIRSAQHLSQANLAANTQYFIWSFGIFDALPLISFAFGCHMQVVPIYGELKNNHENHRVNSVVVSTNLLCMVLYSITGIFGYLQFFQCTDGNILNNLPKGDLLVNIARGALTFVIICHYPPSNYCCRSALDYLIFPGTKKYATARRLGWTFLIWACAAVVAILVPKINVVFGLVGATANSLIVFIFPAIFLLANRSRDNWQGLRGIPAVVVGSIILWIGILISVLGTTFIVISNYFPEILQKFDHTTPPICPPVN